jgi:hypothetical protein
MFENRKLIIIFGRVPQVGFRGRGGGTMNNEVLYILNVYGNFDIIRAIISTKKARWIMSRGIINIWHGEFTNAHKTVSYNFLCLWFRTSW